MSRSGVYKTIKRFKDTGSYLPKVRSTPPRSVRTPKLVNSIRGKLRRNPERSGRQLARELQVSQTTMQNILRKDLKCYPYKKTKRQLFLCKTRDKKSEKSKNFFEKFKPLHAANSSPD